MVEIEINSVIKQTKDFIDKQLLPIINDLGEKLEGNIFFYHLTQIYFNEFTDKQKNLILAASQENVSEILEIGFNSGFSALLFLNANPNISITCVDIGEHKYVIPCYNKIKEFYGDRINLFIGNSVDVLPKLTNLYDLIHIDGAHIESIANEDIINSCYISKNNAILIFDDYDIPVLHNLWNRFSGIFNFKDINFTIFKNKYQSIKQLNKYNYLNDINDINKVNLIEKTIPKIIHHIAPSDKTKWHPFWEECYNTWLHKFPETEYEHKLWNDEEDLENFIKNDFPFFLPIFKSYPYKIQRIDMVKYFILFKYGGIYVDMDYYCYKNFYNTLDMTKPNITCSPWTNVEFLQNSLMASPKNSFVFLDIIKNEMRRSYITYTLDKISYVSATTGPKLISDVFCRLQSFINPLDKELFNPIKCNYFDNVEKYNKDTCYCKHLGTGNW